MNANTAHEASVHSKQLISFNQIQFYHLNDKLLRKTNSAYETSMHLLFTTYKS